MKHDRLFVKSGSISLVFDIHVILEICGEKTLFEMMEFVFVEVENIVGTEENAGNQQFLLFPQYFPTL